MTPFALGITWAEVGGPRPLVAGSIAAAGVLLWILVRRGFWSAFAEVGLGLGLGALALGARLAAPIASAEPDRAVALRVLEAPRGDGFGCRALAWIEGATPGRARLDLPISACRRLPGELAVARLRTEALRGQRNPGGADPRRRAARRGVHARARLAGTEIVWLGGTPLQPRAWIERIRQPLADALDPPRARSRAGALLRTLVLGEEAALDAEVRDAFAGSGTAHLLSVSGLHVALVLSVTQFCVAFGLRRLPWLGMLRRADSIALALGLCAAGFYAGLAGGGAPALRSAAMAAAGALAILSGRHPAAWNALAAAGLVILVGEPGALFDASPWLSFCAVAGLLAWRIPRGALAASLHSTLAASLATAPLLAVLGLPLPIGSVLANAILVPWIGLGLLAPGLVLGIAGALAGAGDAAPLEWLRALAEGAIRAAESLQSPDLSRWARAPLGLFAGLAGAGFGMRLRGLGLAPRGARVGIAAALALAALQLALGPRNPSARTQAWFFDVGHGDAVLLRAARRAWLIDAGGRSAGWDAGRVHVVPALRALGVRSLDALAVTHDDLDHAGGADAVLRALRVHELWITPPLARHPVGRALRASAAGRGTRVRIVSRGAGLGAGGIEIDVLWPPADAVARESNAASLVLRVQSGPHCLALPGDAPAAVERQIAAAFGPCDALKLAHHGSRTSSDALWLDTLGPVLAIASAGERQHSPLPHASVAGRLRERGIRLARTRSSGALRLELDGASLALHGWVAPAWEDQAR